jgi:mannosyl-3-phosphoglycerate phosphatase family protein
MRVIFISDLDGTLLGQTDFRFDEIKDAIIAFLARGISLIPASSKTQPEIEDFCRLLGVDLPFICENGAALVNSHLLRRKGGTGQIPMSSHVLGRDQTALLAVWRDAIWPNLQENCIFLDDMDVADQQAILGLAGEQLARAMDRSHSALFTFKGTPTEFGVLQEQAVQAGLMVQCGGRVCALSAPHDKASFHQVIRQTAADEGSACILVGFGDAQNDVSMLQNSDVACIIPRPECQPLVLPNPPQMLVQATAVAPLGWLETARQALHIIEQEHGEQNG